jgi:hypothetical protein
MSGRGLRQGDSNSVDGDFEVVRPNVPQAGLALASLFLHSVRDSYCLLKVSFLLSHL